MNWLKRLLGVLADFFADWPKPAPLPDVPDDPLTPEDPVDDIDLREVVWDEPYCKDMATWTMSGEITSARVTAHYIRFEHPPLPWPQIKRQGWRKPAVGNVNIIARCSDGKLHGASIEWLLDQQQIAQRKWDGKDDIRGKVGTDFRPARGTEAWVMLSTFHRGGIWTTKERTNAVRVVWP